MLRQLSTVHRYSRHAGGSSGFSVCHAEAIFNRKVPACGLGFTENVLKDAVRAFKRLLYRSFKRVDLYGGCLNGLIPSDIADLGV